MTFITREEYDALYPENLITDSEFAILSEVASLIIDELAMYRISCGQGMDKFSEYIQDLIKKAVAAEISTLFAQGGLSAVEGWGADSSVNSATIGKFSYSGGNGTGSGGKTSTLRSMPLSPLIQSYLCPTGLLDRRVEVRCYG